MGIIVSEVAGKYSTMMFDDKNLGNICSMMISASSVKGNSSNMISASSGGINET